MQQLYLRLGYAIFRGLYARLMFMFNMPENNKIFAEELGSYAEIILYAERIIIK